MGKTENISSSPRVFAPTDFLHGLIRVDPGGPVQAGWGWPSQAPAGPPAGGALSARCYLISTTAQNRARETRESRMAGGATAITSEQLAAPRGCVHELIRRLRSGVCASPLQHTETLAGGLLQVSVGHSNEDVSWGNIAPRRGRNRLRTRRSLF